MSGGSYLVLWSLFFCVVEKPEPPGRKWLSHGVRAGWKHVWDQDQESDSRSSSHSLLPLMMSV